MSKRFVLNICVFAVTLYLARKWKETRISNYFTGYEVSKFANAIDDSQNQLLWELLFKESLYVDNNMVGDDYSSRPDVIRHYLKHGGIEGFKEREQTLIARFSYFTSEKRRLAALPEKIRLLVVNKLKEHCPQASDVDSESSTFQFQVLLPGQTTGLRVEASHTVGRNDESDWLLAAAASSGLFRQSLITSAKAIVFLNKWNSTTFGGSLVYYDKNEVSSKTAGNDRNSLIVLTGTHTIHGITAFRSSQVPRFLIGSPDLSMVFDPAEQVWFIRSKNSVVRTFRSESLHVTLNVDGICALKGESVNFPATETVLQLLKDEMIETKGYSKEQIETLDDISLNDAIIGEYLDYPPPGRALLPFNYCLWIDASPKLFAFLKILCG